MVSLGAIIMSRTVFCLAAALLTSGIAPLSAAADDRDTCRDWHNQEAVAACSRLVNQNPGDSSFYLKRGNAYWGRQDYDRAIADDDQAIRLDPASAFAYNS